MALNKLIDKILLTTLFTMISSTSIAGELRYEFAKGKGTIFDNGNKICKLDFEDEYNPLMIIEYKNGKVTSFSNGIEKHELEPNQGESYKFFQLFYEKARECQSLTLNK